MRNEYSKPLYDLYIKARDFRDDFHKTVEFLMEDESGFAPIKRSYVMGVDMTLPYESMFRENIRTFVDKQLAEAYIKLRDFRDEWRKNVIGIIEKLPQISFRMRFDEPNEKNTTGIRMGSVGNSYSQDMEKFLDLYDKFDDEIVELFKIIGDYEKSIYQPSDFALEPKEEKKDVVYRLRYDEIQGKLYLNDIEVYKSNLGSKIDKALAEAFKTPEKAVKTVGSVASSVDAIKMPKSLKKLVFRASKGSFMVKPEITMGNLKNAKLDKETLDLEIQKFSE